MVQFKAFHFQIKSWDGFHYLNSINLKTFLDLAGFLYRDEGVAILEFALAAPPLHQLKYLFLKLIDLLVTAGSH